MTDIERTPMPTPPDLAARKAALRRVVRDRLRAMAPAVRARASARVCEHVLARPELARATHLMLYMPLPTEVDVRPVAAWWLARGGVLCLPRVDAEQQAIVPVAVSSLEDDGFTTESLGVRAPLGGEAVSPSRLDAVLVPGLAFDASGRRLGRGGGYYDRFLPRLRADAMVVAVAFACQVVEEVPTGPHDRALSVVVGDADAIYTLSPPSPPVPRGEPSARTGTVGRAPLRTDPRTNEPQGDSRWC